MDNGDQHTPYNYYCTEDVLAALSETVFASVPNERSFNPRLNQASAAIIWALKVLFA